MIALLRVLRLKAALQSTVTSKEFTDLKQFKSLEILILNNDFFTYLFVMCRAMYVPMRILRLADQKIATMDKLHYYVRKAEKILTVYLAEAETLATTLMSENTKAVMKTTVDGEILEAESKEEIDSEDDDEIEEEDPDMDFTVESIDERWPGDSLTHRVMRLWEKSR